MVGEGMSWLEIELAVVIYLVFGAYIFRGTNATQNAGTHGRTILFWPLYVIGLGDLFG